MFQNAFLSPLLCSATDLCAPKSQQVALTGHVHGGYYERSGPTDVKVRKFRDHISVLSASAQRMEP